MSGIHGGGGASRGREGQLGRRCEQSECRSRRMTEEESRGEERGRRKRLCGGRLRREQDRRRKRGTARTFALAGSFALAAG